MEPEVEEFNTIGIPKHIEETSEIVCAAIEDQAAATRKHYAYAILEDDVRK